MMVTMTLHSNWFLFFNKNAARNSMGFGGLKIHKKNGVLIYELSSYDTLVTE